MNVWRWIAYGPADGATQMATDRAVLESAVELGLPTMRLYGWKTYCLSLGYHQDEATIDLARCAKGGIDVVRRPTGGRAVLHAEELTYSIVFPKDSPYVQDSIGETYRLVCEGLAEGLRKSGVPAVLEKRTLDLRSHYQTKESVSCFSAAARHEILVDGKKLVGSAQRRMEWGVLQHGSIILDEAHLRLPDYLIMYDSEEKERIRSIMSEKTTTVATYMEKEVNVEMLSACIKQAMEEAFTITFEKSGLNKMEEENVQVLKRDFIIFNSAGIGEGTSS